MFILTYLSSKEININIKHNSHRLLTSFNILSASDIEILRTKKSRTLNKIGILINTGATKC
jgi:hypothetical protein